MTKGAALSEGLEQPRLPVQQLWESSTSGDTALEDKLWTTHLTPSHHLKIYFYSFIFNIQQGTDSSRINLKTTQWTDF